MSTVKLVHRTTVPRLVASEYFTIDDYPVLGGASLSRFAGRVGIVVVGTGIGGAILPLNAGPTFRLPDPWLSY
jgi:hypothetical protein